MRRALDVLIAVLAVVAVVVVVRAMMRTPQPPPPPPVATQPPAPVPPIPALEPVPVMPASAPVTPAPADPIQDLARVAGDGAAPEADRRSAQARLVNEFPAAPATREVAPRAVEVFRTAGMDFEERNALSVAFLGGAYPAGPEAEAALARLDALNQTLVFSRVQTPDSVEHRVVEGDTMGKVSRTYGVPLGLLRRANGISRDSDLIRLGDRLKVQKGPFMVRVDKDAFTLTLTVAGRFLRRYPVGIGREGRTPTASFTVRTKVEDPTWYHDSREIPPDNPENILGTRWIGFSDDRYAGLGIHGTREPDSIGQATSAGCIRMRNADVEDLYDLVPMGATVDVVD